MAQQIFKLDGNFYDVIIPEDGIERSFQILDDDTAGRTLSGAMQRSIIGTYYNYKIKMDTSRMDKASYDQMYELLTSPVDSHEIQVPFGQSTLTFDAYITSGNDTLHKVKRTYSNNAWTQENTWQGLELNFIALEPQVT